MRDSNIAQQRWHCKACKLSPQDEQGLEKHRTTLVKKGETQPEVQSASSKVPSAWQKQRKRRGTIVRLATMLTASQRTSTSTSLDQSTRSWPSSPSSPLRRMLRPLLERLSHSNFLENEYHVTAAFFWTLSSTSIRLIALVQSTTTYLLTGPGLIDDISTGSLDGFSYWPLWTSLHISTHCTTSQHITTHANNDFCSTFATTVFRYFLTPLLVYHILTDVAGKHAVIIYDDLSKVC